MTLHQLPVQQREGHGAIHVWGEKPFTVSHESASGNSWGELFEYETGEAAITAAYAMNRDQYGGLCAVHICDEAVQDTSPGVGLVSLPGDL
jgi:hypothetical protein